MKFGIINKDMINIQAQSKHLRIDVQLKSLERGKRETPVNDCYRGVGNKIEYRNSLILVRVGA